MSEYRRILAVVDFDDAGARAARRAFNLARSMDAELALLHLVEPDPNPDGGYPPPSRVELAHGYESAALRRLAFMSGSIGADGGTLLARYGAPAQNFAAVVGDWHPDLVVAASDPGFLDGRHDLLLIGRQNGRRGWLRRWLDHLLAPAWRPGAA